MPLLCALIPELRQRRGASAFIPTSEAMSGDGACALMPTLLAGDSCSRDAAGRVYPQADFKGDEASPAAKKDSLARACLRHGFIDSCKSRRSKSKPPLGACEVPSHFQVVCVNSSHCMGTYALVDRTANGQPMWRLMEGDRWLYSNLDGKWTIGGRSEEAVSFQSTIGHVYNPTPHGGALPCHQTNQWKRWSGKVWLFDDGVQVSAVEDPAEQGSPQHIRFRSFVSMHEDFTPYASVYGRPPKEFDFDRLGRMVSRGHSDGSIDEEGTFELENEPASPLGASTRTRTPPRSPRRAANRC